MTRAPQQCTAHATSSTPPPHPARNGPRSVIAFRPTGPAWTTPHDEIHQTLGPLDVVGRVVQGRPVGAREALFGGECVDVVSPQVRADERPGGATSSRPRAAPVADHLGPRAEQRVQNARRAFGVGETGPLARLGADRPAGLPIGGRVDRFAGGDRAQRADPERRRVPEQLGFGGVAGFGGRIRRWDAVAPNQ